VELWPDIEPVVARLHSASLMPPVKAISVEGENNVIVVRIAGPISEEAQIISAVGASFLLRL
jgi:hypothetical protein